MCSIQAERPGIPLHVYHLYYSHSPEKAAFLSSVSRETDMFTELIAAKSHLVLPTDMGQQSQQVGTCSRLSQTQQENGAPSRLSFILAYVHSPHLVANLALLNATPHTEQNPCEACTLVIGIWGI